MIDIQSIREWRARPVAEADTDLPGRERIGTILDPAPEGYLREDLALELLRAAGLPVPPARLCRSASEAVEFADQSGYPIVLRVVSPDIIHKSDVGGVALDLRDADAVRGGWERVRRAVADAAPSARIEGLLARPMIPHGGTELIIGAKRDPSFGPVIMFGLGGIYVELFRDVSFALAPLDEVTAAELVRRTKAIRLLEGMRGAAAADIAAVQRCIVRVARLVADFPRIVELDINPLIAGAGERALAVADVRIRLTDAPAV
jgi:acyl-CoA synthetase (NDP forming)